MTKKMKITLVTTMCCCVGAFALSSYFSSLQYSAQERLGRAEIRQQIEDLTGAVSFPDRAQLDRIVHVKGEPNFKECWGTSVVLSIYQLVVTVLNVALLAVVLIMLFREKPVQPPADAAAGGGTQKP